MGLTRPRPQAPGPRVAYFVDVFANHFDQELAESVVGVLRQAGVNVHVPRRQKGSGMAALVAGDLEHARELAVANLRVLGDAVRDGYTVVCSEPTATLMIQREYLKLTDNLDAGLVAENTMDVGPVPRRPRRPGPAPRAQASPPGPGRLPPTLPSPLPRSRDPRPRPDPRHPRARRRVHRPRLLRNGRHLRDGPGQLPDLPQGRPRPPQTPPGTTTSRSEPPSAGPAGCRWSKGVTKRTLHPIKLLGLSYGLNPSLLRHFRDPKPRREVF